MESQLSLVLQFVVNKNISIILDKISDDFQIQRSLLDKYLTNQDANIDTSTATKSQQMVCQGKTKKGDSCTNKPKPGTIYCGKHSL